MPRRAVSESVSAPARAPAGCGALTAPLIRVAPLLSESVTAAARSSRK